MRERLVASVTRHCIERGILAVAVIDAYEKAGYAVVNFILGHRLSPSFPPHHRAGEDNMSYASGDVKDKMVAHRLEWTPEIDARLLELRRRRVPWPEISRELRFGRGGCIERGRFLGLAPHVRAAMAVVAARVHRGPLPAGDPVSWGAICAGTILDGMSYPDPAGEQLW
jgi:hypothetical protein